MAFNGKILSWVNREKWKCEHIDLFGIVQTTNGKRKNHYNYQSGLNKKMWDAMINDLLDNGIIKNDIPKILSSCGLSIASIRRKMTGHEETHIYEMEQMLLAANFRIQFNRENREIFRVTRHLPVYQITEELDRVIVRRNLYPKLHVNFNPNDLKDMEIDFGKEEIISKLTKYKITEFVLPAMLQYFDIKDKKELAKLTKTIKNEINKQFLNEDILIKNKNW